MNKLVIYYGINKYYHEWHFQLCDVWKQFRSLRTVSLCTQSTQFYCFTGKKYYNVQTCQNLTLLDKDLI